MAPKSDGMGLSSQSGASARCIVMHGMLPAAWQFWKRLLPDRITLHAEIVADGFLPDIGKLYGHRGR
jgi:hypothetical protein